MDITTAFLSGSQLALAALVLGIVAIAKTAGLPSQFAPALSLVLGIGIAFLIPSATVALTIVAGITIGLVASGAYSGGKTTLAAFNEPG